MVSFEQLRRIRRHVIRVSLDNSRVFCVTRLYRKPPWGFCAGFAVVRQRGSARQSASQSSSQSDSDARRQAIRQAARQTGRHAGIPEAATAAVATAGAGAGARAAGVASSSHGQWPVAVAGWSNSR